MNALFPIYVKLAQLQTLLVGGGPVAGKAHSHLCKFAGGKSETRSPTD